MAVSLTAICLVVLQQAPSDSRPNDAVRRRNNISVPIPSKPTSLLMKLLPSCNPLGEQLLYQSDNQSIVASLILLGSQMQKNIHRILKRKTVAISSSSSISTEIFKTWRWRYPCSCHGWCWLHWITCCIALAWRRPPCYHSGMYYYYWNPLSFFSFVDIHTTVPNSMLIIWGRFGSFLP